MSSIMRAAVRTPRVRLLPTASLQPRRFAHSSYGNEQSGHEQGLNEKNPKRHLEHPGPETPAEQGNAQSGTSSGGQEQATGSYGTSASTSQGKPTILQPKSSAEDTDPEVRKHNEEMKNRAEKTANQLSEQDNKVDKQFWKGDVGNVRGDQK